MPLPLIPAGIGIVTLAAIGVKKMYDAYSDNKEAEDTNETAEFIYDEAIESLERCRAKEQSRLERLGEAKLALIRESLSPFVSTFSRIKNVDYVGMEVASEPLTDVQTELLEIRDMTISMAELAGGTVGSVGAGALAGLAAYGSVGLLGTASTGTAIGTLSGIAAQNATLAWLGGGSLAAGGMGIAGGTAVLGGIVAAPVLLVGGLVAASLAAKAKEDAYSNLAKARAAEETMKTAEVAARAIGRVANQTHRVILDLRKHLDRDLAELQAVVAGNEDYKTYNRREKELVARTASLAATAKNVTEAPLLEDDGTVADTIRKTLRDARKFLKRVETI